jgi:hypothetical protein
MVQFDQTLRRASSHWSWSSICIITSSKWAWIYSYRFIRLYKAPIILELLEVVFE